ncbi:MAG: OB-fold domain-containing protein, partial [Nanoarchaeota archaeon]|nr:OB-fold domain-containing protein [Nanoarchaeota archaeon]
EGEITSFTIIRVAPEGFEAYTPFAVGMIKLIEGPNVEGQIVGNVQNVEVGKKVKTVFRKMHEDNPDGLIYYGLKWKIVD